MNSASAKTGIKCSIIILNYFGEKVIEETVNSLLNLNYSRDKLEIIIVDNNSQDKSRDIIKKLAQKYKFIQPIYLEKNIGFSAGNNVGAKIAKGEFIVLLNNDCVVYPNWLDELVKVAQKDQKIFAVNSKILLYPSYLKLHLKSQLPGIRIINCFLAKSELLKYSGRKLELSIKSASEDSFIEFPFDTFHDKHVLLTCTINVGSTKLRNLNIPDLFQEQDDGFYYFSKKQIKSNLVEVNLEIDVTNDNLLKSRVNRIQNAGNMVFQNGYSRDIGAVVHHTGHGNFQDYEIDHGQFGKNREVYAVCGGATLIRSDVFNNLGGLNEDFFIYYEDIDLSEKARLAGYKITYCPKAVVRHIHALSSKEWSPFFIYHVEKGRLLHVFNNFPFRVFLREYCRFFLQVGNQFKRWLIKDKNSKLSIYLKVVSYFITNFFHLISKRVSQQKALGRNSIETNYSRILNGRWYFE